MAAISCPIGPLDSPKIESREKRLPFSHSSSIVPSSLSCPSDCFSQKSVGCQYYSEYNKTLVTGIAPDWQLGFVDIGL